MPYVVFGGFKFFERQEIKDIIAYLRVFVNPQDSASLFRIINVPKRGIGESTINQLVELTEVHNVSPLNLIFNCDEYMLSDSFINKIKPLSTMLTELQRLYKELPPVEFVKSLINKTNIRSSYDNGTDEGLNKLLNIDSFISSVEEYFEANPNSNLVEYLESITLISDIDNYDDKNNVISLATVHSAKGLEFKVVFIVGLEEKNFPIIRYNDASDMEEERRLMYVAITRAEQRLYLTHCRTRFLYGKRDYMLDSRFLKEMGILKDSTATMTINNNGENYNFSGYGANRTSFSLPKTTITKNNNLAEYKVGAQVLHTKFGIGTITNIDELNSTKCITIDFKDFGSKTLSVEYAPIKVIKKD